MAFTTLLTPQEIDVYYIIPALKRHIALAMKQYGLKQCQIADILNVKPAAISQYLHNKRGNNVHFTKHILDDISSASINIKDDRTLYHEMQRLLTCIKQTGALCSAHAYYHDTPTNP